MNFNLKKIGTMPIPRGIVGEYIGRINKRAMLWHEISQQNISNLDKQNLKERLEKAIGVKTNENFEESLLAYKKVEKHQDDWDKVRLNGKEVSPGFLHVVLSGSCVLEIGRKKQLFKRGDIFLMNPNVDHEVTSRTFCMTYCWTVPLHETLRKLQ